LAKKGALSALGLTFAAGAAFAETDAFAAGVDFTAAAGFRAGPLGAFAGEGFLGGPAGAFAVAGRFVADTLPAGALAFAGLEAGAFAVFAAVAFGFAADRLAGAAALDVLVRPFDAGATFFAGVADRTAGRFAGDADGLAAAGFATGLPLPADDFAVVLEGVLEGGVLADFLGISS
jgi:hypothetical protein